MNTSIGNVISRTWVNTKQLRQEQLYFGIENNTSFYKTKYHKGKVYIIYNIYPCIELINSKSLIYSNCLFINSYIN